MRHYARKEMRYASRMIKRFTNKIVKLASVPLILGGILQADAPYMHIEPENTSQAVQAGEYEEFTHIDFELLCPQMSMPDCQSFFHDAENANKKKVTLDEVIDDFYEDMTDVPYKRQNIEKAINRINRYNWALKRYSERYNKGLGLEDYIDIDKQIMLMKAIAINETNARHWGLVTTRKKNDKIVTKYVADEVTTGADGERGMYQIMPHTAKWLHVDPDNIYQNIRGATRLMSLHLKTYKGNIPLALNAYNAGQRTMGIITNRADSTDFMDYKNHVKSSKLKHQIEKYPKKVLAILKAIEESEKEKEAQ